MGVVEETQEAKGGAILAGSVILPIEPGGKTRPARDSCPPLFTT